MTTTEYTNHATGPVTDEGGIFCYSSVTPPRPFASRRVRRTLRQRLRLDPPSTEERYLWTASVCDGNLGDLARWWGEAPSHEEACREADGALEAWALEFDRRPSELKLRGR